MTEDWNELRLILAIARGRGLVAAAGALAIDHSTAFRRLQAIENRLGQQLFERAPGGAYEPTLSANEWPRRPNAWKMRSSLWLGTLQGAITA